MKVRGPGRPAEDRPSKDELQRLYVKESRSIREVAEELGCTKDIVYRVLEEYGIERQAKSKRSKLRVYKLEHLKDELEKKGYKKTTAELGVGVTTLRDYMKGK